MTYFEFVAAPGGDAKDGDCVIYFKDGKAKHADKAIGGKVISK